MRNSPHGGTTTDRVTVSVPSMTKRILPLSLALSAVLTFSACGSLPGTQKAEPAPTVTVTADSQESESSKPEASQDASSDATDQATEDASEQATDDASQQSGNDSTDDASSDPTEDSSDDSSSKPTGNDGASSEQTSSQSSSGSSTGGNAKIGTPASSAVKVTGSAYSFTMPAGWSRISQPSSMGAERAFAQAENGKVARVFGVAQNSGSGLTPKQAAELVNKSFRKQGATAVFTGSPKQLDGETVYPVFAKKSFNGVPTQVMELVGVRNGKVVEIIMMSTTASFSNAVEKECQEVLDSWKWSN